MATESSTFSAFPASGDYARQSSGGVLTNSPFQHMIVECTEPQGTNGGTAGTGAWSTRTLNTLVFNSIASATLNTGTNRIVLPGGTYEIVVSMIFGRGVTQCRARLRHITGSYDLAVTPNCYGYDHGTTSESFPVVVKNIIAVPGFVTLELQYWATTSSGTQDLGVASNVTGYREKYAQIIITKRS
jgi:hypothetical protein